MAKATKTKAVHPAERRGLAEALGDMRWWAVAATAGFVAYMATSYALFFFGATWQVPLFVGCTVGLVAAAPLQAMLLAPSVTVLSMALIPPLVPEAGSGPLEYGLALALSLAAAAAVAYTRAALTGSNRRIAGTAIAVGLVVWILANLWAPLLSAGLPVNAYGTLTAPSVRAIPQPGGIAADDVIYRRVFVSMHQGRPYYESFRDAWTGQPAPSGVMGFRLPTLYWLWGLLPPDPFAIIYLYLALCSVGVISAAFITGQLVGVRFAPLAAVTMASYVLGAGITLYAVYVDLPAMSIALAGIALFVRFTLTGSRRALWAAAGVITLAALTREILIYLVVLAALSALLERPGKRLSSATPWLASLGVFTIGYAAHALTARAFLSADSGTLSYMGGSAAFAASALTTFSNTMNGHGASLALLFLAGVVAAFAAQRRTGWPFAGFALAALLLPVMAMLRLGNVALDTEGNQINYWGMLVVPLALSLWPAWALLLQTQRSRERS